MRREPVTCGTGSGAQVGTAQIISVDATAICIDKPPNTNDLVVPSGEVALAETPAVGQAQT